MPQTMTPNLTARKNQLSQPGAWVWLLTMTLPDGATTLRFAANTEDVVYGGNTYTAFNFSIDSFGCNTDGEIPELTMVVTNIGYAVQDYMRSNNGLIGSVVSFVCVDTDLLSEDYSEDLTSLTVTGAQNTWPDIELSLSVPAAVRYRVPENRYNPHSCWHKFRTSRCGYDGSAISAITKTSGAVVSIDMAAAHGFTTGESVEIEYSGITGLDGVYTITVVDTDTFTLDGTDGADYSGTYTSGGLAGYATCDRIPAACITRGRFPGNYGGPLSLRREGVRYA